MTPPKPRPDSGGDDEFLLEDDDFLEEVKEIDLERRIAWSERDEEMGSGYFDLLGDDNE